MKQELCEHKLRHMTSLPFFFIIYSSWSFCSVSWKIFYIVSSISLIQYFARSIMPFMLPKHIWNLLLDFSFPSFFPYNTVLFHSILLFISTCSLVNYLFHKSHIILLLIKYQGLCGVCFSGFSLASKIANFPFLCLFFSSHLGPMLFCPFLGWGEFLLWNNKKSISILFANRLAA